ncbi:phage holin family protein [uncultured Paracoccus sp.]|uniref:phage holin family protein n=1 Tax=uncultured Paracoccus sp. TaxID=189685 RepID=UPI002595B0E8|nr:phage holin family protein [uncultured Paracoccus sp.]
MFDYTRNLQLAVSDKLRRAGLSAGAGVALLIGAGFLLAALWTWLAYHLGWGALGASLTLGIAFVLIGLVAMLIARKERHPLPTTDDLKAEVEQRLRMAADVAVAKATGAADAAMDRATDKVGRLMEQAGQRVHSFTDNLSYKADRLADRAEARVYGAARRAGETAADRLGLPAEMLQQAAERTKQASQSRIGAIVPLIGAFAVGMTLASRLQDWRHRDEAQNGEEWEEEGDWPEDPRGTA